MSTLEERRQKFLRAHPAMVQFDDPEPMKVCDAIPTEGRGCGVKVPWYCAGFFRHPTYYSRYIEKHEADGLYNVNSIDRYIRKLPGGERVTPSGLHQTVDTVYKVLLTTHSASSPTWTKTCVYSSACMSISSTFGIERRVGWSAEMGSLTLSADFCSLRNNFAWHMFKPQIYSRVPHEITLHVPSAIAQFNSIIVD